MFTLILIGRAWTWGRQFCTKRRSACCWKTAWHIPWASPPCSRAPEAAWAAACCRCISSMRLPGQQQNCQAKSYRRSSQCGLKSAWTRSCRHSRPRYACYPPVDYLLSSGCRHGPSLFSQFARAAVPFFQSITYVQVQLPGTCCLSPLLIAGFACI